MEPLSQSFVQVLAGLYELDRATASTLDSRLFAHLQDAQARWPGVKVSGSDFATHLARHAPESDDLFAALASMHTTDLYLALGASMGDPQALTHFERSVLTEAPKAIARVDSDGEFISEVLEDVRIRLLVADGRAPRIGDYAGRGPLTSWVMVAALRRAYSIKRAQGKNPACDDAAIELVVDGDNELERVRAEVAGPFREAFAGALEALDARARTVLRLYLVEEVSSEAIATMYNVHRATVARWISSARSEVQRETRRRLKASLRIGDDTFESLMRNLLSRFDLPLSTALGALR
ncbi:MAG: sigma-70 family RNA polymerase sigma factor [Myxococcota bacterium]